MQLSAMMKKLVERYTLLAIIVSSVVFLAILVLTELKLITSSTFIDTEVIIYTLFSISLSLFVVLVFVLALEKKYEKLNKNITGLIAIMVILFITFLVLIHFDLAYAGGMGAGVALMFAFGLFPFTLFMFICSLLIFLYKKQYKTAKKVFLEFLFWIVLLVGAVYLVNLLL